MKKIIILFLGIFILSCQKKKELQIVFSNNYNMGYFTSDMEITTKKLGFKNGTDSIFVKFNFAKKDDNFFVTKVEIEKPESKKGVIEEFVFDEVIPPLEGIQYYESGYLRIGNYGYFKLENYIKAFNVDRKGNVVWTTNILELGRKENRNLTAVIENIKSDSIFKIAQQKPSKSLASAAISSIVKNSGIVKYYTNKDRFYKYITYNFYTSIFQLDATLKSNSKVNTTNLILERKKIIDEFKLRSIIEKEEIMHIEELNKLVDSLLYF